MILLGTYNLACAITYAGLLLAMAANVLSFHHHLSWAMVCFIGCGLCDLFDGWVARRLDRTPYEAAFGLQIDSLADMAVFGLTPVIILLHSGLHGWIDFAGYSIYLCAAAIRLAHFNQTQTEAEAVPHYYTGLPVTYAALIFPLVVLVVLKAGPLIYLWALRVTVILTAFLFVSKFSMPKPRGSAYVYFVLLAAGASACWLLVGS
jgi:CDP-diacylglycerol--serine O-phosphatidyltransferase